MEDEFLDNLLEKLQDMVADIMNYAGCLDSKPTLVNCENCFLEEVCTNVWNAKVSVQELLEEN